MKDFLGLTCCRRIIDLEKIVEVIIETYGVRNLDANIEQLKNVGINIKCPFCKAILWVNSLPLEVVFE